MPRGRDIESTLREVAADAAAVFGLEVYDLHYRRSGPRWKLQLFLDRPGGRVSLEDCERVSRQLSRELDVLDPIPHAYDLEVSSPGMDRPLRQSWHWERTVGEKVHVRWRDEEQRTAVVIGTLRGVDDDRALIEDDKGEERAIPLDRVLGARVHIDW
jgi:ribosome maturation factor RimP